MRYLGGKHKIGYLIARLLNNQLNNPCMPDGILRTSYVEPFVGGANVIKLIRKDVERIGSDICEPLIDYTNMLLKATLICYLILLRSKNISILEREKMIPLTLVI